jgi:PAS domain S-box-containing protein
MALQGTSLQAAVIREFRELYSAEVAGRARSLNLEVTHDFANKERAIPLPATLTIQLGEAISRDRPGAAVRLYSDYPFPWRKQTGGVKDAFEADALRMLRARPEQPFYRFENFEGRPSLRYAVAERMQASCVACHNTHPESPKTDWKEGDVRGVLQIIRPLGGPDAAVVVKQRSSLKWAFGGTAALFAAGLAGLSFALRSLRRTSECLRQSEQRVRAIIDTALDAVVAMDCAGIITEWNAQAETMFGWSRTEAVGCALSETIVPPRFREAHERGVKSFLRTGEAHVLNKRIEITAVRRDGSEFPIELTIAPLQTGSKFTFSAFVRDISERRQAEAKLRETLRSLTAINAVLDRACLIARTDVRGDITYVNDNFCRLSEYSREELLGRNHRLLKSGHHHDSFFQEMWQTIANGGIWRGEVKNRSKSGRSYWVETTIGPLLNEQGKPEGYMAIRTDITERKHAEEALQNREQQFDLALRGANDGLWDWNLETDAVYYSPRWKSMLGYGEADVEPQLRSFEGLLHPDDKQRTFRLVDDYLAGRVEKFEIEFRLRHQLGHYVDILSRGHAARDAQGRAVRMIGTHVDITERKRAEAERTRLVNFLEASWNEVYVFDTRTLRFSYVNRRALNNLGYSAEQIQRLTPLDLKPEFTEDTFRRMVRPLLDGTQPKHVFQTFHRRADGSEYPVEICLQVVSTTDEKVFLAVINDITERKRTEAELARANKELLDVSRQAGMAEVATGVLHNVGNVLNSVNVAATVLNESVRKSPVADLGRVVTLLREQGENLGAFFTNDARGPKVRDFLAQLADKFTRQREAQLAELASLARNIEHIKDIVAMQQSYARISGVTEPVKVTDLVEDALRLNAGAFQRHEVEVVRDFAPGAPDITTEKHKVLQILVNLVRNAKYACDESGRADKRMTVRVTHGQGRVRIQVADNGVGIPPENLTRIFNHGFTTKKDGHGFGLHSGANAAKELGGSLVAHSDGQGRGATFTLELPAQPAEAERAPANPLSNAA